MDASFSSESYTPDRLHAGDFPVRTLAATLSNGQNLSRGALLGKITVGGEVVLSLAASGDGSEVPFGILAADADASGGAIEVTVYVAGDFNENAMTFGTGHTADSVRDGLRDLGIYLTKAISA